MPTALVPYSPNPSQVPFHLSTAFERLLIGGFGSGKSYALCAEAIKWMLENPGIRGMIGRATATALKASTETVFVDLIPPELWARCKTTRVGGHYDTIIFPNGSEVHFRSLDDWKKLRSANYGFAAVDEADEIDEETWAGILSRVRQRDPTAAARAEGVTEITRRGAWMAMNPAGHSWHWTWFVKNEKGEPREWFRTTSLDNPYLPPEYIQTLLSYPATWIKRFVLADWGDFGGQIYEDFSREHNVIGRLPRGGAPEGSAFWMALDPGTRDPTAGLWVIADPRRKVLIGVAEYQEHSLDAAAHARAWRGIEAEHRMRVAYRVADPGSINVRDRASNNRLSDVYRRLGFTFNLGPTRWEDRITPLGTLIANQQFLLTEDCPQTIESIAQARWKDLSPAAAARGEDPPNEPLKKDRHLCDCAEYLAAKWLPPKRLENPAYQAQDGEAEWSVELRAALRKKMKRDRPGARRQTLEGIPL